MVSQAIALRVASQGCGAGDFRLAPPDTRCLHKSREQFLTERQYEGLRKFVAGTCLLTVDTTLRLTFELPPPPSIDKPGGRGRPDNIFWEAC